jgi:hypothetical protein
MEPVKDDTIDLDWNPKMELDTTEYQIGDAIDEQGLSDPIFPNEFTSELVQVLRKKKKL